MRIAISNIAWDISEDESIAKLLNSYKIDAIDIAPGKYFDISEKQFTENVIQIKDWWNQRGIEITGMQSLLFGTSGLNIFDTFYVQNKMLEHLNQICEIANILNSRKLVFGSPKNRDCKNLDKEQAKQIGTEFFNKLGNIAKSHNIIICLEPNPKCYGANFMTNTAETAEIVRLINHSNIKMQLDTGAIFINQENITELFNNYSNLIGHIHISEPNLIPIGDGVNVHSLIADNIQNKLSDQLITIEMLATKNESHLESIERAIRFTQKNYLYPKTKV